MRRLGYVWFALAGIVATGWLPGVALAAPGLERFDTGTRYYFAQFDPSPVPWDPGSDLNIEEVFKNYEYYQLAFGEGRNTVTVRRVERGKPGPAAQYRLGNDGALVALVDDRGGAVPVQRYQALCASCHGNKRLGVTGPALLPVSLKRLGRKRAAAVIAHGRPATQMPGFGPMMDAEAIDELVEYLFTAPDEPVHWGASEIRGSRVVYKAPEPLDRPRHSADPLNLFTVVEAGDHHVTVLDGDRLEPIHRFPSRYALHGGLKYSPDGRFVYLGSRDGWVSRFDLYTFELLSEIRVGINTRNIAISHDGRYVLAGNYLPHTLVLLSAADLSLLEVIPVLGTSGASSRVSAVYQAAPRESFIAALKDVPEVWEIRPGAKIAIRRIDVEAPLDDFFFDPSYRLLIGADRRKGRGQVVNLDSGRVEANIDLPGLPHLGSGITWQHEGRPVMATPNLKEGSVTIIDMNTWKVVRKLPTQGPGFFMRSHENTPYAWVDVFFGPHRDLMHVIDKRSLEIVKTLRPAPGKTSGHVEFTRDGSHALVSIWDQDGALVVYDANTLEEKKRLPMRKPSGKYNVWNKITRSEGTSH